VKLKNNMTVCFSDKGSKLGMTNRKALSKIKSEMITKGISIIDFDYGESGIKPHLSTAKIVKKTIDKGLYPYPSSFGKNELRKKLAIINNTSINNIIISSGVKYQFKMIADILFNPKDQVIVVSPNWLTYRDLLEFGDVGVCNYFLDKNFSLNINNLKEYISTLLRPKAIIFSNPNNPTGKVFSNNEIIGIIKVAKLFSLTIISDEVFSDLVFNNEPRKSIRQLQEANDYINNIIVLSSASKNYGMTSFRVGYIVANPTIVEKCSSYMLMTMRSVPEFIQDAYLNELNQPNHHNMWIGRLKKRYYSIVQSIKSSNNLRLKISGGGITIFPEIKTPKKEFDQNKFATSLLKNKYVAISKGSVFNYPFNIRLTFTHLDIVSAKKGVKIIDEHLNWYI